ncbi:MAG: DUF4258 domain-containing protein [Butyrivibrio sp.]|nr:DUF4258 domain-containing protein [Butyrivibrio sp.]MBR1642155.1 DUF4258 domain-containing protein [Butyrivibrio sp.]
MEFDETTFNIEEIRSFVKQGNVIWREHAIKRLRERRITKDDVRNAIYNGEIIEERPDDIPTPCCLILGANVKCRFMHVICGVMDDMVYIISAYYPDPNKWEPDLISRKGQ